MCGIAGYMYADPARAGREDLLRRMTDVIAHRGPDGEGFHVDGNVALGHRRLAILDLETGDQPMFDAAGSVALILNGEIYNYVELREELRGLGHGFVTQSDTEVLLKAYAQWGIDCQQHLNGMWAFALWDGNHRRLLLSRDRLGEKPLHYALTGEGLVFGSEMKSLFAFGLPRHLDTQWLEVFCCLGYLPAPHTFYEGILKLPPASYLLYQDGQLRQDRYWDLPEIDENDLRTDQQGVEEEFEALLRDSVRIRMRADVPYGAFLSGGLDSSSIVALMAEVSAQPVKTFTIGFSQKAYDERSLAREVARRFGTEHFEQEVEPEVFEDSLQRVMHHYDEPFGDSSAIPTGLVSRHARQHVKMVLSGDGGDEALSGYTMYQGEKFAHDFTRLPRPLRAMLPPVVAQMAKAARGGPRYKLNRARNVLAASNLDFTPRLVQKLSWADVPLVKDLLGPIRDRVAIEDFVETALRDCPYRDTFYRLMYYHLKVSLPDDMLVKVDRMSMAFSLEVRTPFLDHRLIELMVGVDKSVKMHGYQRKTLLRNTVARRLPSALLEAPKKGFGVPIGEWFKGKSFADYTRELLHPDGFAADRGVLETIVRRNERGEENYGNFLWILVLLSRFYRQGATV